MGADDVVYGSTQPNPDRTIARRVGFLAAQEKMGLDDDEFAAHLYKGNIIRTDDELNYLSVGVQMALERISEQVGTRVQTPTGQKLTPVTDAPLENAMGVVTWSAEDGLGGGIGYPAFETLSARFRPSGEYGPLEGFMDGTTGQWVTRQSFTEYPGQKPDIFYQDSVMYSANGPSAAEARAARLERSTRLWAGWERDPEDPENPDVLRRYTFTGQTRPAEEAAFSYTQAGLPTSFIRREKEVNAFRNKAGQFDRRGVSLTDEEKDRLDEVVRVGLLKRYDELIGRGHGGEQTDALRAAVAQTKADVVVNERERFELKMTLPDLPGRDRARPAFNNPRPSTGVYGKYVFMGRGNVFPRAGFFSTDTGKTTNDNRAPATKQRTFLHFQMHGEYITSKNVLPSRTDINVFENTAEMRKAIGDSIKGAFAAVTSLSDGGPQ